MCHCTDRQNHDDEKYHDAHTLLIPRGRVVGAFPGWYPIWLISSPQGIAMLLEPVIAVPPKEFFFK